MKNYIRYLKKGGLLIMLLAVCVLPGFRAAAKQQAVQFDTFEQLQDSCIELERKISLASLLERMPDTIAVYAEGQDGKRKLLHIPVSWESDPDYQTTDSSCYIFHARWDEECFHLDSAYNMEAYTPFIEVILKTDMKSGEQAYGSHQRGIYSAAADASPQTLEEGLSHIVERARQQVEIPWTPLKNMKGYISSSGELTGTYKAGTTYYGIPYGQLINSGKYVPHDASFDTFLKAVDQEDSVFYQKRGSYDSKNSTYYGSDCSAFVSYAYGLPRMTTTMISQSSQFSKVKGNSLKNAQPGDCFNRAGSHVEMITDIIRDSEGVTTAVEVCEQTPPKARKVVYTPEKLQSIIDSGYTLLRFKKRQFVESPDAYKGYHDNSSISHLAAPAVQENQKAATCMEEGVCESVVYCALCGRELSRTEKRLPAGPHVFEEAAVIVEAGCVTEGEQEKRCKECGEAVRVPIPAAGHRYESEIVPGTCKEQGYTRHWCTVCGAQYIDQYTGQSEHSYQKVSVVPPGCTEKGFTVYSCSVCQYSYQDDYTDAKGHTYAYINQKEETHTIYCTVCGSCGEEPHSYKDGKCVCGMDAVDLKTCELLLSGDSFTYTGNSKKPDVTVKDTVKQKTLKAGQDYVVSYTNNMEAGTAAAVIEGKGGYKGTVSIPFTIKKAKNSITASSITVKADPVRMQSAILRVQTKSRKVTFRSNSSKIRVDGNGKVTISGNYVGKGQITITSGDSNYSTVTKKIDVVVTPIANPIIAGDITKITSVKAKQFSLEARCSGGAAMKYNSSNPLVKVNQKGSVTVNKSFVGESVITIQASAKGIYKAAAKKIKVTVIPAIPRAIRGTSPKSGQLKLEWRKIAQSDGYQLAYTTDKNFKSEVKTMKLGNGKGNGTKLTKTVTGLKKEKTYYVRIRTIQVVKGKTYYSQWSSGQAVKVK